MPAREDERHLWPEQRRPERRRDRVKAPGLLSRAIEEPHPEPEIAHDAGADEAHAIERRWPIVRRQRARHRREDRAREPSTHEAPCEDARDDPRGGGGAARAGAQVLVEEPRDEAAADDEPRPHRASVVDAQRRPGGRCCRARRDRVEEPRRVRGVVAAETPVSRHGGDRPARRERDRGKGTDPGERAEAGHVRAIASSDDHGVGRVRRESGRDRVEIDERSALGHLDAGPRTPERREERAFVPEVPRAAVDDQLGTHDGSIRCTCSPMRRRGSSCTMRAWLQRTSGISGIGLLLGVAGCGSVALHAAEHGDNAALRSEIAQKHARGKLSNGEATNLARAVAEREIAGAKDEATALVRLGETRACALELDDAFATRMKTKDGAGAEAALARLEDGKLGDSHARDWLDDADDRWRAVATRTLHRGSDQKRRRAGILDPSPKVRRSAIRAAGDAGDLGDLGLLFETARVDPEPMLRNEAVRAMSGILRKADDPGRAASFAITARDLWTASDDALKEDIAVVWALEPVFENGGREALRVAISDGKGPGAIAAAAIVARIHAKDTELVGSARGLLARTIGDGSRRDRLHALAAASLDGSVLDAARKAAWDDDREVKISALGRLLDVKTDRDSARKELTTIASYGVRGTRSDDASAVEDAMRARSALASAGELRIQAWIEEDLGSAEPRRKTAAAYALAALGRSARAAPLLADPDVSIRTRIACTMLVASRH